MKVLYTEPFDSTNYYQWFDHNGIHDIWYEKPTSLTNYKSLNFITMSSIEIENFYILIGDIYYRPLHKTTITKNKIYLTLDVLEHAD